MDKLWQNKTMIKYDNNKDFMEISLRILRSDIQVPYNCNFYIIIIY